MPVTDESLLEKFLQESDLSHLFHNEKSYRRIAYEIVRLGLDITPNTVFNEMVFSDRDIVKNEDTLKYLRDEEGSEAIIEHPLEETVRQMSHDKDIREGFAQEFVERGFGPDMYPFFSLAQELLNQTGMQRVGGKKMKDAHIFVHSARIAGRLFESGASSYACILGLLHDVLEDIESYKVKEYEKVQRSKEETINILRTGSIDERVVSKVSRAFDQQLGHLKSRIESPPELDAIRSTFLEYFSSKGKDEQQARAWTDIALSHLDLLSHGKWNKKDQRKWTDDERQYQKYTERLFSEAESSISFLANEADLSPQEYVNALIAPLLVKLEDNYDNTKRSREMNSPKSLKRLYHNLFTLHYANKFLGDLDIRIKNLEGSSDQYLKDVAGYLRDAEKEISAKTDRLQRVSLKEVNFNIGRFDGRHSEENKAHREALEKLKVVYQSSQRGGWPGIQSVARQVRGLIPGIDAVVDPNIEDLDSWRMDKGQGAFAEAVSPSDPMKLYFTKLNFAHFFSKLNELRGLADSFSGTVPNKIPTSVYHDLEGFVGSTLKPSTYTVGLLLAFAAVQKYKDRVNERSAKLKEHKQKAIEALDFASTNSGADFSDVRKEIEEQYVQKSAPLHYLNLTDWYIQDIGESFAGNSIVATHHLRTLATGNSTEHILDELIQDFEEKRIGSALNHISDHSQGGFYLAPFEVLCRRAISSTSHLSEDDMAQVYAQMQDNLIILKKTADFLESYNRQGERKARLLPLLCQQLVKVSTRQLNTEERRYSGDQNPHIRHYSRELESIRKKIEVYRR